MAERTETAAVPAPRMTLAECDAAIVKAQARADQGCRCHDRDFEWVAEHDLQVLWEIRDGLIPEQRDP